MAKPAKTLHIKIDQKPFQVPESENPVLGAYLRQLGEVHEDYDLWQKAKGNEDDALIAPDVRITLGNGDHFYTVKKVLTPGSSHDRS